MAEKVAEGVVEVAYVIYKHGDGPFPYDWWLNTGEESENLFKSIEEAEQDVRQKLGA